MTLDLQRKLDADTIIFIRPNGLPEDPLNDYQRRLFARRLKLSGRNQEEIKIALLALGLDDVSPGKRLNYIRDILNSVIVGFPNDKGNLLPAYMKGEDDRLVAIGGKH